MAIRLKANIGYQPVVEEISRKFVPRKETCSAGKTAGPVVTITNGWMGGAVKTAARAGLGVTKRNYLVVRSNGRGSAVSADELEARANFKAVSIGANGIMNDLTQISRVQSMFEQASEDRTKKVNGIYAYGYTMRGWVFAVQMAGLQKSSQYDVTAFPQNFD